MTTTVKNISESGDALDLSEAFFVPSVITKQLQYIVAKKVVVLTKQIQYVVITTPPVDTNICVIT